MTEIEQRLAQASKAFNAGEVTSASDILRTVDQGNVPQALIGDYYFLKLGCALYYKGDIAGANKLNAELPFSFHPAVRYRLALRQRNPLLAKRIRTAYPHTDKVSRDFGWSACLSCLWSGKLRMGSRLYHYRIGALNFGDFVPEGMLYEPYHDTASEGRYVFLEQGIGDILLHLHALRKLRGDGPLTVIGSRRYQKLLERYFPTASFIAAEKVPNTLAEQRAHASGDYLVQAYLRTGSFAPEKPFASRSPARQPVFGVCWRGGSGQNRREERRIPLQFFLDQLPHGRQYVALQIDLSDAEKAVLRADGRVQIPLLDIRGDPTQLADLVQQLAGVISIDSANWHIAGMMDVPIYALMNKNIHWYWRKDGQVSSVYANAETVDKTNIDREHLHNWVAVKSNAARLAAPSLKLGKAVRSKGPVLITGVPRSGTSMIAGVLAQCGLWMGRTIAPTADNPKGFYENRNIREEIIKPTLQAANADPFGVKSLPDPDRLPLDPMLKQKVTSKLVNEGYDGISPWGYKEPKLTLLWPLWVETFPTAHWVIVRRDPEAIAQSCVRTSFMARHSTDPEYWRSFVNVYNQRLDALVRSGADCTVITAEEVTAGHIEPLKKIVGHLGLEWNTTTIAHFIDAKLMQKSPIHAGQTHEGQPPGHL